MILHMLKAKIDNLLNMRTVKNEKYNYNHVCTRLLERHGLTLTFKEYQALNRSVINKQYYKLPSKDDSTEVFATTMISKKTGRSVAVVFNSKTQRIETVLP